MPPSPKQPSPPLPSESWTEYRRLVLAELERCGESIEKLAQANIDLEREFSDFKTDVLRNQQRTRNELLSKLRTYQTENRELNHKALTEIKVLKGKAAAIGFFSGLIVSVVAALISVFYGK
jgi:hypothetical protein